MVCSEKGKGWEREREREVRRWKTSLSTTGGGQWDPGSKQPTTERSSMASAAGLPARARKRNRVQINGSRVLVVVRFVRKVFGLKFAVQRRLLTQHRLVPSRNPKQTLNSFLMPGRHEGSQRRLV